MHSRRLSRNGLQYSGVLHADRGCVEHCCQMLILGGEFGRSFGHDVLDVELGVMRICYRCSVKRPSISMHSLCLFTRMIFAPHQSLPKPSEHKYNAFSCLTPVFSSNVESKTFHTTSVLINHALTILLWIICLTEQHTLISRRLFVLAYTAWLRSRGFSGFQFACEI